MLCHVAPHKFAEHLSGGSILGATQGEKPLTKLPLDSYAKSRIFSHARSVPIGYTSSSRINGRRHPGSGMQVAMS